MNWFWVFSENCLEHHSSQIPTESPEKPSAALKALQLQHTKQWHFHIGNLLQKQGNVHLKNFSLLWILFFTQESRAGVCKGQTCRLLNKRPKESQASEPQWHQKPLLHRALPDHYQLTHTPSKPTSTERLPVLLLIIETKSSIPTNTASIKLPLFFFFQWDTIDHIFSKFWQISLNTDNFFQEFILWHSFLHI